MVKKTLIIYKGSVYNSWAKAIIFSLAIFLFLVEPQKAPVKYYIDREVHLVPRMIKATPPQIINNFTVES